MNWSGRGPRRRPWALAAQFSVIRAAAARPEAASTASGNLPTLRLMSERLEKIGWYGQLIQAAWLGFFLSRSEIFLHSFTGMVWLLVLLVGTPWLLVATPCAVYFLVRLASSKIQGAVAPGRQIALSALYVLEAIAVAVRGFDV